MQKQKSELQRLDEIMVTNPEYHAILANLEYWALDSQKFNSDWELIFTNTSHIDTQQLWLHANKKANIITFTLHIRFSSLKFLCLSDNNIISVEDLQFLNADTLEELNFDSNRVIRVRSLRKCHLPNLQYISTADNPIKDMQSLIELGAKINRLDIQYDDSKVLSEDISWVSKFEHPITRIYSQSRKRILRNTMTGMLKKMNEKIEIYEKDADN